MYSTLEIKGAFGPHVVKMAFELPYLDWCRFEKSDVFRQLVAYLEELEMREIPNEKQEN